MSLPLSVILSQLESCPTLIVPILLALHYDKTIMASISKPDARHLVSRALNLVRAHTDHSKWCGVSVVRVICGDMGLIAAEGAAIFTALLKSLESYSEASSPVVLSATVDALSYLCQQIRGKPTLTRELLTPRLAPLISQLVDKLQYSPALVVDFLRTLMWNHPTTFRPYANKLRQRLLSLLARRDWANCAPSVQTSVYQALAALPVIEKNDAPSHWQSNVLNTVREVRSVLSIYGEFLNLNDDPDVQRLMEALPSFDDNACAAEPVLPALAIDVNDPELILLISDRLATLFALLTELCTFETAFPVRVPLGTVMTVAELACTINVKFVSFRNDIRDGTVQQLVRTTLARVHRSSVALVTRLVRTFKGNTTPHAVLILGSLEALLPMNRGRVEYGEMLRLEALVRDVLVCATAVVTTTVRLADASPLLRLVDMALALLEPRTLGAGPAPDPARHAGKQRKGKAKNGAVPLADLLSHEHLFAPKVPLATERTARLFFAAVLLAVGLPVTQQHKIMRQAVVDAVMAQHQHQIPADVRALLVGYITLPSSKTASLLPMVSRLFPTDPVLTVFNNPRFPPMPMHIRHEQDMGLEEMEFEESSDATQHQGNAPEPATVSNAPPGQCDSPRDQNEPAAKRHQALAVPLSSFQDATFEETTADSQHQSAPTDIPSPVMPIIPQPQPQPGPRAEPQPGPRAEPQPGPRAEPQPGPQSQPSRAAPRPHVAEYSDDSDFEMPQLDGAQSGSDSE